MNALEAFNMLPGQAAALPVNSPSPVSSQSDSLPEHDLAPLDDFNEELSGQDGGQQPKRKSRRPPSTAERRATHNAVERARRESLNGRFMDLAGALPNMANVKRPSKSVIVAKSLEFVQGAQAREQFLMGQNDTLRQEINDLRVRLGMPALSGSPVTMTAGNLPEVHRGPPRKASSVSSSNGSNSPHMPSAGFDGPPAPPTGFAFKTAYASAFPAAQPQAAGPPPAAANVPKEAPRGPPASSSYSQPAPALDVNYLMALSLQQQQQQQSIMNMQGMPSSYAAVAPWLMPQASAPVAVGGDSPWLFS